MDLQLKRLRKAAGYKSRDEFAAAIGINPLTYKGWETGRSRLRFEDACMLADVLGCTLDDLAGLPPRVSHYSDPRQAQINSDFDVLDEPSKDAAAAAIRGMAAACAQSVSPNGLKANKTA